MSQKALIKEFNVQWMLQLRFKWYLTESNVYFIGGLHQQKRSTWWLLVITSTLVLMACVRTWCRCPSDAWEMFEWWRTQVHWIVKLISIEIFLTTFCFCFSDGHLQNVFQKLGVVNGCEIFWMQFIATCCQLCKKIQDFVSRPKWK